MQVRVHCCRSWPQAAARACGAAASGHLMESTSWTIAATAHPLPMHRAQPSQQLVSHLPACCAACCAACSHPLQASPRPSPLADPPPTWPGGTDPTCTLQGIEPPGSEHSVCCVCCRWHRRLRRSPLHPAVTEAGIEPDSEEELPVQDAYTPESSCWGCGPSAPDGLRLKSFRIPGDWGA